MNLSPDQSCDPPVIQVHEDQVFIDGAEGDYFHQNSDLSPKRKCVVSFDGARYTIGNF